MGFVRFRIGSNFGNTLGGIAQEHLIYGLDPGKALRTIAQSLLGIPEDLALKVLSGRGWVLGVTEDGGVEVRERTTDDTYPALHGDEVVADFIQETTKEAQELGKSICRIFQTPRTSRYYTVGLTFSPDDLMSLFEIDGREKSDFYKSLQGKIDEIKEDILDSDPDLPETLTLQTGIMDVVKTWGEMVAKKVEVISWMVSHGIATISSEDDYQDMLQEVQYVKDLLISKLKSGRKEETDLVTRYLEATKKTDQELRGGLKPLGPEEHRNAIWVSPEGVMYGLSGVIADMLHTQIADALLSQGVIKWKAGDSWTPTVDSYLESEGWTKLHDDWVMFEPFPHGPDRPPIFMTDSQVKVISEYLRLHHGGWGKFGIRHNPISYVNLKAMDKFALNRLYEV